MPRAFGSGDSGSSSNPDVVPRWDMFWTASEALNKPVPVAGVITSIEISEDASLVVIHTTTPALIIGRRGATGEAIRISLRRALG